MTLVHRHLDIPPSTPPEQLPLDALDDLLERGTFDEWRPRAAAIRRDPRGALADRVLRLCRVHPMYGTSRLWAAWIERLRQPDGHPATGAAPSSLADLRHRRGVPQRTVAEAMGISQSDVSKLERRGDMRLSTLRRYVGALGAELRLEAGFGRDRVPFDER
jgi:DNA-binding Xre family transcriptional regulator